MAARRAAFVKWRRRQDPTRWVFLDEAGVSLAMGRSHAWVQRGEEYVEPRPMNWGDSLTLVGAIRRRGWVVLSTHWGAMSKPTFIAWARRRLAPRLRHGDIVVLDNLSAHKAAEVRRLIERRGARLKLLPPCSPDFNPIEPVGGSSSAGFGPRRPGPRSVVTPEHCRQFFARAGYGHSSGNRD